MALITRLSRLFRADVNAVLDRIEEPTVLLRQAVREMEEVLAHDEQRGRLLAHERLRLEGQITDLDRAVHELADPLDTCFGAGKDDLARALIRRRLEAEQRRRLLEARRDEVTDALAALQRRLDDQQHRLDAMRQKADLLADEDADRANERWTGAEATIRDEDVEVAFLREKQRRAAR